MIIELTTSVFLLFSSLSGAIAGASIDADAALLPAPASPAKAMNQPMTLENYIREYFQETPILAEIAKCESRMRHLGKNGKIIRGELTVEDIGVMQINEFYHEERAKKLGFDLHTLDGNLAYAKWLYAKEGAKPWLASSKCWQRYERLAKTVATEPRAN